MRSCFLKSGLFLFSLTSSLNACEDPADFNEVLVVNTRDMGIPLSGDDEYTPDIPIASIPPAGGDTTHQVRGLGAFVQPVANLSLRRRGSFESGLQFFQLVWEPHPNRSEIDGLGPTYNARSCLACHRHNGRGALPTESKVGTLIRLGNQYGEVDPNYGGQLQTDAISGVTPEGSLITELITVLHQSGAELTHSKYYASQLEFGSLASTINQSARITPQLVGMGLIEAIPEASIARLEDPNDNNGDGISGRAARDHQGILRYGWKATQYSVLTQCASAFINDMGITNYLHPIENCPTSQAACQSAGSPQLDIDEVRLKATASYVSLLGVPASRHTDLDSYKQGLSLFLQTGCGSCHQPDYLTGIAAEPELSNQKIWPYSDFLLHDMGEALDDGVAEGDATSFEWRTPPLWGIGLLSEVHGVTHLLHDGRANSVEEAILWHGGEATQSVSNYLTLDAARRIMLINFVRSL